MVSNAYLYKTIKVQISHRKFIQTDRSDQQKKIYKSFHNKEINFNAVRRGLGP